MHREALWPTFICTHEIESRLADAIEAEYVKVESNFDRREAAQYSDFGSDRKRIFDPTKKFPKFFHEILNATRYLNEMSGIAYNEDLFQYWTQDYREPGDHHWRHSHGATGLSGTYYIRAGEGCGRLALHNPIVQTRYYNLKTHTQFNGDQHVITPRKGLMVLFPSWLEHEALPNPPGIERAIFGWNFLEQSPDIERWRR